MSKRLAVLLSFSGAGGVERMVLNLLPAFVARGVAVDLLAIRAHAAPREEIPREVRFIDLHSEHNLTAAPAIARYLKQEQPAAMLAAKDRAIRAAVRAKRAAHTQLRLVGRLGTHLSEALAHKNAVQRFLRVWPMRRAYALVDHIAAVSQGVAEDTAKLTGLPANRISVIRNPVVTPRMQELAEAPLDHAWFAPGAAPVIVGAGRLTLQKDFASLLKAFALVRKQRPCRLLILGEGGERALLTQLAAQLNVSKDVALPGHQGNPYPYMKRAALFVLSSRWEGSPNVLTEALALGTPVVATDCPSGPREILEGGRIAPLVAVGDADALARAMLQTLAAEPNRAMLRAAAREYTQEASAARYLEVLGFA